MMRREVRDAEVDLARKSTRELESEIARCVEELDRAGALEDAAEKRHALERRPETEEVYRQRQRQVERIRRRYRGFLKELGRRNDR